MFKCPYCGQDSYAKSSKKKGKFESWKAVRNHLSNCKLNIHSYTICDIYGPLLCSYIESFSSIEEFKLKYPKFSGSTSLFKYLRKTGKSTIRSISWTKKECIQAIQKWYNIYNKIPQYKDFSNTDFEYPSTKQIQTLFGTWNAAIEAAGFEANYNDGFGIRVKARDGILYRSLNEVHFVNHKLFNIHHYIYEPQYNDGSQRRYDFYLPDLDLYIEIDGGLRPDSMIKKIEFNKANNRKLLVLSKKDVYSNKTLEELMSV